jgi:hypothetical protein
MATTTSTASSPAATTTTTATKRATASDGHIYDGSGDDLAGQLGGGGDNRLTLLPDVPLEARDPDAVERIRIMWGQRLIDDLIAGRYRALVCAVNAVDNTHGIVNLLAERLPTSQWREPMITEFARHFVQPHGTTVVKYDMDRVKVLGLLRPREHEHLTLNDLSAGFRTVSAMLNCRPDRLPVASVCFLGARANRLTDGRGHEPSFESVLKTMYQSGYRGDVYPAPWMWESATGVFPRYPFPDSFRQMCDGGF